MNEHNFLGNCTQTLHLTTSSLRDHLCISHTPRRKVLVTLSSPLVKNGGTHSAELRAMRRAIMATFSLANP